MARALRIEYEGALYHVTCRGNERHKIFQDDKDRHHFLELLGDSINRHGMILYVYVLMDNHFHLMVETPLANLSQSMHRFNTAYTVYFNRRHNRVSHLYQGRYKAILVDKNAYLLELSRYIHLNPVRAGIVLRPEDYKWSSYREYIGLEEKTLVERNWLLRQFGSGSEAIQRYKTFVEEGLTSKLESPFKNVIFGTLLGSKEFVEWVRSKVSNLEKDRSVPARGALLRRVALNEITERVSKVYKIPEKEIRVRRKKNNIPRKVSIFLSHRLTGLKNKEIGEYFDGISESAVTEVVRKLKKTLSENTKLAKKIKQLEAALK